jgi:quinoprotein glucose dehydrogenase
MQKTSWFTLGLAMCLTVALSAQNDWRTYGNDPGHQRFSTLTQITPENVGQLTKAWEFDTKVPGRKWQNTPVVIDNTMYITLQNGGVVALEPETGKELWRYETPVRGRSVRAVAYWPGDADAGPSLLYGAGDKLHALDPKTGKLIESFGDKGVADAHPGRRPAPSAPPVRGEIEAPPSAGGPPGRGGRGGRGGGGFGGSGFSFSSPPAIYKNLAIYGGSEGEGAVVGPPGDPLAIDVKTGEIVWRFHAVPQPGEPNFSTWGERWKDRGGPAIWGLITVDQERGLVFLPTGNPGGSFYGGDRPGDNLYAVSVVALDANTGKYKWHYQTTRHDIFDADLAGAPALIDVVRDGKRIPAVAQITKMGGMLFILDRLTGKPIFGVEDRKVPASQVPGEKSAPTQPFPSKPAPWSRLGMTKGDITTVTPESNKFCTDWWEKEQMYNDGPYTPYAYKGVSVVFSGTIGGGNWGGVAFNPELGLIFGNTSSLATIGRMVPDPRGEGYRNEFAYTRFWDNNKYPCQQPPWGELVAISANTGDIVWKIPFGVYPELMARGIPPTGTPNLGGPITTATGLVLIGATKDARFRAYDAKTGKELWYAQLEAAGGATPMTFLGRNGKQYVVIASGGPGDTDRGGTELYPQKLVAFALPDKTTTTTAAQPAIAVSHTEAAAAPVVASYPRAEEGRALTEQLCTTCHGMSTTTSPGRDAASWRFVVNEMIGFGAAVTDDQALAIVDYLARDFPAKK